MCDNVCMFLLFNIQFSYFYTLLRLVCLVIYGSHTFTNNDLCKCYSLSSPPPSTKKNFLGKIHIDKWLCLLIFFNYYLDGICLNENVVCILPEALGFLPDIKDRLEQIYLG